MFTRERLARMFFTIAVVSAIALVYQIWQRQRPIRLAFNGDLSVLSTKQSNGIQLPVAIHINDIQINLPIFPAVISDGKWEATDKGVSFLSTSPVPGEKGNSIIYGHNYPNILGRLVQVRPGAEISIDYENGASKRFVVKYTATVSPDQIHVIGQTSDTRVTIYTCSGFWDSKRFVVVAVPV